MKATTNNTGRGKNVRDSQQCRREIHTSGHSRALPPEVLAHCLADLKVQLALRQAMP